MLVTVNLVYCAAECKHSEKGLDSSKTVAFGVQKHPTYWKESVLSKPYSTQSPFTASVEYIQLP